MIESLLVLVVLVVVAYLIVKLSSRTQLNYWCACSCMCMDVRASHLSCRRRNRFWII